MGLVTDTLTVETSITGTGIESAADARITAQKGAANGICELDASSLIPANRLPSFVDDVLEYANLAAFPVTGATGKIYVALNTNKTYRWSGSVYIEISASEVNSVFGRTGTYSGVPNYTLDQFGWAVNVAKDNYKDRSEFEADLFPGMRILVTLYNTSGIEKTIGFNIKFCEVRTPTP